MTLEQKDAIASVIITLKFQRGQVIVVEGDPASSYYIIKEGQVQILKGNKEIRKMNKGEAFGEQALYYNTVRGASVKALNSNVFPSLAAAKDILIGEVPCFRQRYSNSHTGRPSANYHL